MRLAICMPSHRPLNECRQSIDLVIEYARRRGCDLIISDNSLDLDKEAYILDKRFDGLIYKKGPINEYENWRYAISWARADYIAYISDDDYLMYVSDENWTFPAGNCGFRPAVVLWGKDQGFSKLTNFEINESHARQRVQKYLEINGGANSTLFSFWQATQLRKTVDVLEAHPLKMGYYDWAIVLSLIAVGPLTAIKDTLLVYDIANWVDDVASKDSLGRMFIRGGMPAENARYVPFFLCLDAFILIMRDDNGVDYKQKLEAAVFCLGIYFSLYKKNVMSSSSGFTDMDRSFVLLFKDTFEVGEFLRKSSVYLDGIQPGLARGYEMFWKRSIKKDWACFV